MFRTPDQKKTHCTSCPIAKTADLVGDTVVLLIVRNLLLSPQRFTDLALSLQGVSSRTLTSKLKFLTEVDVVTKDKKNDSYYTLTQKGAALTTLITDMEKYGKKYL